MRINSFFIYVGFDDYGTNVSHDKSSRQQNCVAFPLQFFEMLLIFAGNGEFGIGHRYCVCRFLFCVPAVYKEGPMNADESGAEQ
jgi:hypothetical protein